MNQPHGNTKVDRSGIPAVTLDSRMLRRSLQLVVGLSVFGAGIGLMALSDLGLSSWDILHQGLARLGGPSLGGWSIIVSGGVLLLWIPLRERPGPGTVANVILVGISIDATMAVAPDPTTLPLRGVALTAGIVLMAVGTAAYIGAGLGPGPRDGLMTGLARRGISLRFARTGIEIAVIAAGWALGGTVGIGTVAFALTIGPATQALLPRLTVTAENRPRIHPLLLARRSPRAFSSEPLTVTQIDALFEAARWAPSSANIQPWMFLYAVQADAAHSDFVSVLDDSNAAWAARAPLLGITISRRHRPDGTPNRHASHDTGLTLANLMLQAATMDLYVHPMGGFDRDRARSQLGIPDDHDPEVMFVVGRIGDPAQLSAYNQERESAPRARRPRHQISHRGRWPIGTSIGTSVESRPRVEARPSS